MAQVITVAQRKGGSGKTTLAVQLAVLWARAGQSVALLDSDPQQSLAAWHALRSDDLPALTLVTADGWKVPSEVDRLARKADIVIIDTPPHAETAAKSAIRKADLCLIPMQPSPVDLWATRESLAMAAGEKVPSLVVLNRLPPRGRLAEQISGQLGKEASVAQATLGNRQAFASAFLSGRGVADMARPGKALDEVAELAEEVSAFLSR